MLSQMVVNYFSYYKKKKKKFQQNLCKIVDRLIFSFFLRKIWRGWAGCCFLLIIRFSKEFDGRQETGFEPTTSYCEA